MSTLASTIFSIPRSHSSQKPIIPSSLTLHHSSRCCCLFAHMVSRESMLQAHLQLASLARTRIRKGQYLLAPPNRTSWFLLLLGVTITRLLMLLQHSLLVLTISSCCLNRHRTSLTNNNLSAIMVGFWTLVGLIRSMFHTKHLHIHKNIHINNNDSIYYLRPNPKKATTL